MDVQTLIMINKYCVGKLMEVDCRVDSDSMIDYTNKA